MRRQWFAEVASNGYEYVIWGFGRTPDEAHEDALSNLAEEGDDAWVGTGDADLRTVRIGRRDYQAHARGGEIGPVVGEGGMKAYSWE